MRRQLMVLIGACLLSQVAAAQDAGTKPASAPAPAATTGTPAGSATGSGLPAGTPAPIGAGQQGPVDLPGMQTRGQTLATEVATSVNVIKDLLSKATEEKDIIRINCLKDKLTEAVANQSVATDAANKLQSAVVRRNDGDATHELGRLAIVRQKAQELEDAAQRCTGQDLSKVGATTVQVNIDPKVRKDDSTKAKKVGSTGTGSPDRPHSASPAK